MLSFFFLLSYFYLLLPTRLLGQATPLAEVRSLGQEWIDEIGGTTVFRRRIWPGSRRGWVELVGGSMGLPVARRGLGGCGLLLMAGMALKWWFGR